MIKTVILNSSEVKVTGPDGDNAEIHNFGTVTVYASKSPNITAGADNVIAVSSGAIDGLSGTGGTVYLLGKGKVQVNFTDEKVTRTSVSYTAGNGSGVMQEYVDEKDADTLVAAKEYADMLNSDLSGYVGYTDNDIYGLEADFENCVFTRLAGAVGKTPGADFDSIRAYGGRRRCNLSDSGEVLAYYGDESFKADGTNGQVMVEQPCFYYKVVPLKTEKIDGADGYHLRKARYYISDTPKAGFKIHPAFVRNGVEVDRIYLSAFEGSIYDTSAGAYLLNDEQVADFEADKLSSIAGAKPCSGLTQKLSCDNIGKLTHNRGDGWKQYDIQTISAVQMLFIIEYAAFNSQLAIGRGNVNKTDSANKNESESTGTTLELGSASGNVINQNAQQFTSYRGEENLWGNMAMYVDGISIDNSAEASGRVFGKVLFSNDSDTNLRVCYGSGYISSFGYSTDYDWLFVASEHLGNNELPIGDYNWDQARGKYAFVIGGSWNQGDFCGIFNMSFGNTAQTHRRSEGGRLAFVPRE